MKVLIQHPCPFGFTTKSGSGSRELLRGRLKHQLREQVKTDIAKEPGAWLGQVPKDAWGGPLWCCQA